MTEPNLQTLEDRRKKTDCSDHEKRLIGVEHVTADIQKTMLTMVEKLDKILEKVNRIDILEEKHSTHQADLTRAHRKIESLEAAHDKELEALKAEDNKKFDEVGKRIETLSVETRAFANETKGMAKMAWYLWSGIGATTFLLLIKVLFFTSNAIKIGM